MKKLIAMLLAVVMVLGLVACGGNSAPAATDAPAANAPAADAPAVEAPAADEMTDAEKEAEIRYAISLLFDRDYIVEKVAQGGQVPASSFVAMGMKNPDGTEFYKTAGNSDSYDGYYDVSEAAFEANVQAAMAVLNKYYKFS